MSGSRDMQNVLAEKTEHLLQNEDDKFKASFKYYKRKNPTADLSEVVDFVNCAEVTDVEKLTLSCPTLPPVSGLQPVKKWKVYCHKLMPGFFFISNPFEVGYQEYWIQRCITDFPCKPNICNLDAHMLLSSDNNIWRQRYPSECKSTQSKTLMEKLRWVTLGYHHNWDTKHYSPDSHSPFPADLAYLSGYVAEALGLSHKYHAEAAIINYYHMDSTLAGHTDHSEFDLNAPLLSFSFGQSAIFLVGGTSKETKPVSVFLRSGDITVLSGASRLAYHAIPRILAVPEQHKTWGSAASNNLDSSADDTHSCGPSDAQELDHKDIDINREEYCSRSAACSRSDSDMNEAHSRNELVNGELPTKEADRLRCITIINEHITESVRTMEFGPFSHYLDGTRINMNVRQVFKREQTFSDIKNNEDGALVECTDTCGTGVVSQG